MRSEANSYKAEVERSTASKSTLLKEFAKFLIDKSNGISICIADLPDLVKEMVGDK